MQAQRRISPRRDTRPPGRDAAASSR